MGCQETVTLPVNRTCLGYELRANLNFDSDNDGDVDADDHSGAYWNSGAGWDPIGSTSGTAYTGYFDGNSDTDASGDGGPYVISNLFMNWTSGNYAGLFAHLQPTGNVDVSNVAIENADVTMNIATDVIADVHVGILAGRSEADISRSYTTGRVKGVAKITTANSLYVGGLVGLVRGADVTSSYSWAVVEADARTATHSDAAAYAGGLVGVIGEVSVNTATNVIAGFAAGDVTAKANATGTAYAGGLAGLISTGAAVKASYARGDVHGGAATAASNYRGALAGHLKGATSQIAASFATGALTGEASSGRCGIVGHREGTSTINDSYYNSDTLGQTSCSINNGTGKTHQRTPDAHRLRHGQRRLRRLEPRHRRHGQHRRRPVELRHGQPVPRHQARLRRQRKHREAAPHRGPRRHPDGRSTRPWAARPPPPSRPRSPARGTSPSSST